MSNAILNVLALKRSYNIRRYRYDQSTAKSRSVGIIIRNVRRVSRAKSRICTWPGPSDKFQRNLAGRALAFLLFLEWKSSKNAGASRARTCLEKFRENVRGNPLSVTSLPFDFLSITCFSHLCDLAHAYDDSGG